MERENNRCCGQPFNSLWAFVAWAEQQELSLDLRSPWQRPKDLDAP
jgi:hypothetical protein